MGYIRSPPAPFVGGGKHGKGTARVEPRRDSISNREKESPAGPRFSGRWASSSSLDGHIRGVGFEELIEGTHCLLMTQLGDTNQHRSLSSSCPNEPQAISSPTYLHFARGNCTEVLTPDTPRLTGVGTFENHEREREREEAVGTGTVAQKAKLSFAVAVSTTKS